MGNFAFVLYFLFASMRDCCQSFARVHLSVVSNTRRLRAYLSETSLADNILHQRENDSTTERTLSTALFFPDSEQKSAENKKTTTASVEASSQTESTLRTHRICQTSALSMRSRECQTETRLDMPTFSDCGDPVSFVGVQSATPGRTAPEGKTSDAPREQDAESDSETSPMSIAQDSSTRDSDLKTSAFDVDTAQLEAAHGEDKDNSVIPKQRPVSLLECIPSIPLISDSEDRISPIPECSLVPRKIGKHVTFRDDESFKPIEPAPAAAAADNGCDGGYQDVLGDDSDSKYAYLSKITPIYYLGVIYE